MTSDSGSPREIDSPSPATRRDGVDGVALTREDVAALLATYRKESRSPRQWFAVATGMGGLFSAVVLINLGEHYHWPETLGPVFLVGGWIVLLSSLFVVTRRERQLRARYQAECPACGERLLDRRSLQQSVARAELAIATGNCPSCGANFLAR
jgi:hypothetical protein